MVVSSKLSTSYSLMKRLLQMRTTVPCSTHNCCIQRSSPFRFGPISLKLLLMRSRAKFERKIQKLTSQIIRESWAPITGNLLLRPLLPKITMKEALTGDSMKSWSALRKEESGPLRLTDHWAQLMDLILTWKLVTRFTYAENLRQSSVTSKLFSLQKRHKLGKFLSTQDQINS
jgi:hypothetical protein